MALRANLVNLDAMIKREDFAAEDEASSNFENVSTISLRDFTKGGLIGPSLRKPDFQRETNHWSPSQVVSLLECFVSGDLIPSVILWQSPTFLFVIDGGHRLSVLRAWVEDDYGDGPISQAFFGYQISEEHRKIAERTRTLVNSKIGSWKHYETRAQDETLDLQERRKLNAVITRGLPIQWVKGDADKAESSFFKINTKGTPLDEVEELLLKSRKKPISIAARAVIRAGRGHKYWSSFSTESAQQIEAQAKRLHTTLFDPEIKNPIKTLELPLGGSKGVRTALQALIDFMLIANKSQSGEPKSIYDLQDDEDGSLTATVLNKSLRLANRITGNDNGSLGLHPAVYFYGETGRHLGPLFMGTVSLIGSMLRNNNDEFFRKFTINRSKIESTLIARKELIATIIQKSNSAKRVDTYSKLLNGIINDTMSNKDISEERLVELAGLSGKIILGNSSQAQKTFSDETKSEAFIRAALSKALKCDICQGYLDTDKSVSYDHEIRVRDGGAGTVNNCKLAHPYCNQSIKN